MAAHRYAAQLLGVVFAWLYLVAGAPRDLAGMAAGTALRSIREWRVS